MTETGAPSGKIRVAVVDDHPLMRDGVIQALRRAGDLEVVGEGQSADDAVTLADKLQRDVVLLDVNMPGDGIVALRRIVERHPGVSCIVMSVREDEETVSRALKSGARGYVLKGIGGQELVGIVRAIDQGDVYVTPSLAARLLASDAGAVASAQALDLRLADLTERETGILRLLGQGLSNKEIAASLGLSDKTIKHYVTVIFQKLQVRNRVEAALIAQRHLQASD